MFDTLIDINNWSWRDLNAKPSACKADALPIELQPLYLFHSILRHSVTIYAYSSPRRGIYIPTWYRRNPVKCLKIQNHRFLWTNAIYLICDYYQVALAEPGILPLTANRRSWCREIFNSRFTERVLFVWTQREWILVIVCDLP